MNTIQIFPKNKAEEVEQEQQRSQKMESLLAKMRMFNRNRNICRQESCERKQKISKNRRKVNPIAVSSFTNAPIKQSKSNFPLIRIGGVEQSSLKRYRSTSEQDVQRWENLYPIIKLRQGFNCRNKKQGLYNILRSQSQHSKHHNPRECSLQTIVKVCKPFTKQKLIKNIEPMLACKRSLTSQVCQLGNLSVMRLKLKQVKMNIECSKTKKDQIEPWDFN